MSDIYSLLMTDDEPTAQEKAQAMAAALRRKHAVGTLGMLTGDKVLSGYGQTQLRDAEGMGNDLASAGRTRSGNALSRTIQKERQDFSAGEAQKGRDFQAKQGGLNRAMQRELLGKKAEAKDEKDDATGTSKLRIEFDRQPDVKAFREVEVAFDKIRRAATNPSAAGDLSLIFSYMKVLDPGSTVREGEFANAQNAAGVPDRVVNQYNKVMSGERLGVPQRADFINQAKNLYASHQKQAAGLAQRYRALAAKQGFDPDDVALSLGATPGDVGPAPGATGTIKVTNGTETREIDAADLAEAEADGYQAVR